MFGFVKRRREFIVDEKDVMDVLKTINTHLHYLDGQVGIHEWGGDDLVIEMKWFIVFYANNKKYSRIIQDLNEIGEFKLSIRPKGQIDWCFNRRLMEIEAKEESQV